MAAMEIRNDRHADDPAISCVASLLQPTWSPIAWLRRMVCRFAPIRCHRTLRERKTSGTLAVWGIPSQKRRTRAVSSPLPRHAIGRSPRQPPHPPFLAALFGLLCLNGAGALELATHAVVAPRHALRAEAMCAAAHHAALGIEAALIAFDGLPLEDLQRSAVLRDAAEVSLEALEAEWQRTIAWIDGSRKQLASASVRAADLTSLLVGATSASATLGFRPWLRSQGMRVRERLLWGRMRLVKARLWFSFDICGVCMHTDRVRVRARGTSHQVSDRF